MPRISKGLTRRFTLRLGPIENAIIAENRKRLAERDITLSENDTIRFLLQRTAVDVPLTPADARAAIEQHCADCPDCTPSERPRCPAGIYLADCYTRVRRARQGAQ